MKFFFVLFFFLGVGIASMNAEISDQQKIQTINLLRGKWASEDYNKTVKTAYSLFGFLSAASAGAAVKNSAETYQTAKTLLAQPINFQDKLVFASRPVKALPVLRAAATSSMRATIFASFAYGFYDAARHCFRLVER